MGYARSVTCRQGGVESDLDVDSRSSPLQLPLVRLLQLLLVLHSERFPNARRLAEVCAVSRRTIYRDLATLDAAGIAVRYHPDRQGYQLARECFLQPTQLEEKEALGLLIVSRSGTGDDAFGLAPHLRTGVAKVLQALPGDLRSRVVCTSELIPDNISAVELPRDRLEIYESIWSAMSRYRQIRLWYREGDSRVQHATKLGIYGVLRVGRIWSLVGRSTQHRDIHVIRVPWILRVELTDEPYTIPPRFDLERFLSRAAARGRQLPPYEVRLRFTPLVAPAVHDLPRHRGHRVHAGPDGELELFLSVDGLDELVSWILGFGDQVEVLHPEELRNGVRDLAGRIARIHSPDAG